MEKKKINKASVVRSVTKIVSDKEVVRSYMKGNTDFKTLKNKGIKFAKPI